MKEEIIVRQKLVDYLNDLLRKIEVNFTDARRTGELMLSCSEVLEKMKLIRDNFSELSECEIRETILEEIGTWISRLSGRATQCLKGEEMEELKHCVERWKEELLLIPPRPEPIPPPPPPPGKKVTKVVIGDYQYEVKIVPVNLILGRCDPPDPESDKPSHLGIKDEGGKILYLFKNFKCLHGCPRPDAPEGCTHREHVKIEIKESVVRLIKMKTYPLYVWGGSDYSEVDQLELRVDEKALISIAGLRWLETQRDRRTETRPYIEVSVS